MGQTDLEQQAFQAVNGFLSYWDKSYLSRPETAPVHHTTAAAGTEPRGRLPPIEWKYYARPLGTNEAKKAVQFLTIWSQPTLSDPVPRATAKVWVTYQGGEKRPATAPEPTLTYRFEHQHLVHTIPYTASSESEPPVRHLANPAVRLPEIIAAKQQVSDAILHSKLLQSRTWAEFDAFQKKMSKKTINGSTQLLGSSNSLLADADSSANGSQTLAAGLSPWTHTALNARGERAQTAVSERVSERDQDAPADEKSILAQAATMVPQPHHRQIDAATVMGRTYLPAASVAQFPPMPEEWKIENRTADPELLRYERNARMQRRRERAEARKAGLTNSGTASPREVTTPPAPDIVHVQQEPPVQATSAPEVHPAPASLPTQRTLQQDPVAPLEPIAPAVSDTSADSVAPAEPEPTRELNPSIPPAAPMMEDVPPAQSETVSDPVESTLEDPGEGTAEVTFEDPVGEHVEEESIDDSVGDPVEEPIEDETPTEQIPE
ncbi:hypothetical protein DFJ77DRAFT_52789 [Powellomyces hirtus]|nr:hypothetical protein DFJ77DRAFT_52789 [Powellomyces hirtus]